MLAWLISADTFANMDKLHIGMDKKSHPYKALNEITYPFPYFDGAGIDK